MGGRNREDSVVMALWVSSIPWDVLVSQILPRLFQPTHSCDIYGQHTAADILDRVVVGLLTGWLHWSGGGRPDLACALEDVCREMAHQWYGDRVGKGRYTNYKNLILDDNSMGCHQWLRCDCSPVLMASLNRYGSEVDSMSLCRVDEMEVGLGRRGMRVTLSIESNGSMQASDIKVASIAVVRMRFRGMKTYGEVIQDLYREGLYPTFLQKMPRSLSYKEKTRICACDMEARQCMLYPGFSASDVLLLSTSTRIVPLHEDGRHRVRVDFLADDMLETIEELCSASKDDTWILFTYGSEHPLVHHQEGSKVYHPCRLEPLEVLVRAKRNRVRGYPLQRMNEWIPVENTY